MNCSPSGMRLLAIQMWVLVLITLAACRTPTVHLAAPDGPVPTAEQFAQAQAARVAALSTVALRGHAEIRWRDERGGHFDDGDFDLLIRPPSEMSLRVSKLGERILWVGAGDGQWWIVFPRERPSRALLRPWSMQRATVPINVGGDEQGLSALLVPTRLVEVLGLSRVGREEVRSIDWDETRGAWRIKLVDCQIFARGESLLPVGCEWFDADGRVIARCALDGFEWVRGERAVGSAPDSSQPLVATRISFSIWSSGRSAGDGSPDSECAFAAEAPSFGGDRIKPQLFNWTDVQAALRPEVVEDGR
ncbi:MAG: hypothetical protein EXS17_00050 [Phycisphaerales bacterium]|nr:hypothetical protein [Phycisphaerales bacterium]